MNVENYKVAYAPPAFVPKPHLSESEKMDPEAIRKYAENVEKYNAYEVKLKEYDKTYSRKQNERLMQFRQDLAIENGLDKFPKAISDKVYAKAWEDGHSSGLYEVATNYEELAEMVLDIVNIIKK